MGRTQTNPSANTLKTNAVVTGYHPCEAYAKSRVMGVVLAIIPFRDNHHTTKPKLGSLHTYAILGRDVKKISIEVEQPS